VIDIDEATGRPRLTEAALREVLLTLGVEACEEHVSDDEQVQVAALLGTLMAATQWQIQGRRQRYANVVDQAYHNSRAHLDFPPCECGSPHDHAGGHG
jgi:hypothetical protein